MPAPDDITQLVDKFERSRARYAQPDYNEAQLRQEFVNPFFAALGWDVGDSHQVLHEAGLKSGGSTKHPDYSFLVGRRRAFYVETKKPAIDISQQIEPAGQLRSYGWSGNTAVGILTNFAEFAVYDCRIPPEQGDSAAEARVWHLTSAQYPDSWGRLCETLSPRAVRQGRHKDLLADVGKGALPVDAAFLRDMESWRATLAEQLYKQARFIDRELSQRELNQLVQRTIDRIVFLRIAEDRSLEPYGTLERAAREKQIYEKIKDLYRAADKKYNSGLFHFDSADDSRGAPDKLAMDIYIPDNVLQKIIFALYPPQSRYEFSVIAADILGQVYERFLGKVIEVRSDGQETRAAIEEKPEVRKAGGVYYTPSYIVDYIVDNTLGKLLDGATPEQAARLRVLDPACGSGSFLTGAYQYLLDWHIDYYRRHPAQFRNRRRETAAGILLTTSEKRRILLNNIYGVDLDQSAVEVSKLSLLLKMLENETDATGLRDLVEPILPDLGDNIKWGNSLVGSDFFAGNAWADADEEELLRVKTFDWASEAGFGEIMAAGGFDAVIGNPPYVRQEILGAAFKGYAKGKFATYAGTADLYTYFIERGVTLLRAGGAFGIIVANKWLRARYGRPLRAWLKQQAIREIVDFGDLPVFEQATTYPCILTIGSPHPRPPSPKMREGEQDSGEPASSDEKPLPLDGGGVWGGGENHFAAAQIDSLEFSSLRETVASRRYAVDKSLLDDGGWSLARREVQELLRKLSDTGVSLKQYVNGKIHYGIKTGFNEAFYIDGKTKDRLIAEHTSSAEIIKPLLRGRDIKRFTPPPKNSKLFLIFSQKGIDIDKYPAIKAHLQQYRTKLEPKPKGWKGAWSGRASGSYQWYELQSATAYQKEFEKPKIMLPDISLRGNFILDESGEYYCVNTAYIIASDDKYLLGILNSKLITFVYSHIASTYRGGYLRFIYQYLAKLPIRTIDFGNPDDVMMHGEMVALVETMLDLHKQLPALAGEARRVVELRIEATDKAIDELVYRLYGLGGEEVGIVEGE
ncbi:MAG: Eco57I restriction-modification methylase domain-containing protein [Chloroflexi bacterium]|nr:Eco57I restriction-modification methylase domain-containing protein [Chloroflexota bacterium]MCY4247263.1 Eco57I restriction-modification methylase domain-containing protein [Chloroflexota bacterium]